MGDLEIHRSLSTMGIYGLNIGKEYELVGVLTRHVKHPLCHRARTQGPN